MNSRCCIFYLIANLFTYATVESVHADSGDLSPLTLKNFAGELSRALAKNSIKNDLSPSTCLPGDATKRTVCQYKLGRFMQVIVSTAKGGQTPVEITMICSADEAADSAKCLVAYASAMSLTTSGMTTDVRGKIIKVLIDGLSVGNSTTVTTDDRKYILQKSIGLWFHIMAADLAD